MVFELKWGILSTGKIAATFSKDLLIDPSTRDANDVKHTIAAVASRSQEKAADFIKTHLKGNPAIRALGTYEELYNDPEVNCIYIATPHAQHYENTKDALNAGKAVLLEKPATVNAAQLKVLIDLAKKKNVYFQEGVWTRFFPIAYSIQQQIKSGAIGRVRHVEAEFCLDQQIESKDPKDRLIDPKLSGGSLLDILTVVHPYLEAHPTDAEHLDLPKIASSIVRSNPSLTKRLGGEIDESSFAILTFPGIAGGSEPGNGSDVTAIFKTSLVTRSHSRRTLFIQGTKGHIEMADPPYRAKAYVMQTWDNPEDFAAMGDRHNETANTYEYKQAFPGGAHGFVWEADSVARHLRDGKIENERCPWRESVLEMELFDEIRRQSHFKYPEDIERV